MIWEGISMTIQERLKRSNISYAQPLESMVYSA